MQSGGRLCCDSRPAFLPLVRAIEAKLRGGRRPGRTQMHWSHSFIEALGYLAAAANAYAYVSNTMIPLRVAAILANALFASYALLLPLNIWRLLQMKRLITAVRLATEDEFHSDWLRPYMRPKNMPEGVTLYRKDDTADAAYVIVKGK